MIHVQPTTYKTSDGVEFDNLLTAQLHEDCLVALKDAERAQEKFFAALAAKHYLTADGHPVSLQTLNWIIVERQYEPPYVHQVELRWYSSQARYYFSANGTLCVSWKDGDRHPSRPVTEFYASEKAARLAVIELRKKHIGWWQDDLHRLEVKASNLRD